MTGQALSFVVTTDNNALFSAPPAVSPTGTLTYTSAAGASGTATVTVVAHDDGGTAAGGVDASAPQSFTITVVADTVAPVCSVTRIGVDGEGRKFVEVTAQDAASGITRIEVTTAVNIDHPGDHVTVALGRGHHRSGGDHRLQGQPGLGLPGGLRDHRPGRQPGLVLLAGTRHGRNRRPAALIVTSANQQSASKGRLDAAHLLDQTMIAVRHRLKPEVAVERRGRIVDGVDNDQPGR